MSKGASCTGRLARAIAESLIDDGNARAIDELRRQVGTPNASTDLQVIPPVVRKGKVRRVFVAVDDSRPGLADPLSGKFKLDKKSDCDLLNEVAAGTLLLGGEILALPKEQIPGDRGVAAGGSIGGVRNLSGLLAPRLT